MYHTANKPTWRRTIIEGMLAALMTRPAAALIATPKIHLWVGDLTIDSQTPLATFTGAEATFSGYPAGGATLGVLSVPLNLLPEVIGLHADNDFIVSDPPTITETVSGYWIDYGAGADWLVAEAFASPVPMAAFGDFLVIEILLPLPLEQQAS